MQNDTPIHIVLAADQRYFDGLYVTAGTMARYATESVRIVWNVLDGGIDDDSFGELSDCILSNHRSSEIRRVKFDVRTVRQMPEYHGSRMTFARLFLPSILPSTETVIYCDTDFTWHADVAKLWSLRSSEKCIQAVVDGYIDKYGGGAERDWCKRNGFAFREDEYFCAGLMIMNLDKIRKLGYEDLFAQALRNHPDVIYADQTILNAVLPREEISLLPKEWERFASTLDEHSLERPFALHYAAQPPWRMSFLNDATMLWFSDMAKLRGTGVWQELRRFHSPAMIVFSRAVFLLVASCSLLSALFESLMRLIGHPGVGDYCQRNKIVYERD